ncbi:hypothetical protein K435DRAFT_964759 [Dendrothele bispora CBS 962.96]|uniref:Chromo domain-containing protein n=1 Tax=Dendrothele bispora (strain CBS 962.96) TaxID=1314807 RepID=A0A4S8M8T4_DENBC|nr:hypothetical protein K435DRAFT_964759 [Dendrothele bispora CBS 962.96]
MVKVKSATARRSVGNAKPNRGKSKRTTKQVQEPVLYEVELIKKGRVRGDGALEFFLSWRGYNSDEDRYVPGSLSSSLILGHSIQFAGSCVMALYHHEVLDTFVIMEDAGTDEYAWQVEDNLKTCDRLIGSFLEEVEFDRNNPAAPGTSLIPSAQWIEKETEYYLKTYGKDDDSEDDSYKPDENSGDEMDLIEQNLSPPSVSLSERLSSSSRGQEEVTSNDDSEDEIDNYLNSRKRKRVLESSDDENDDEDDDNVPLTHLRRSTLTKTKTNQTFDSRNISLNIDDLSLDEPLDSPLLGKKSKAKSRPRPPSLVIPSPSSPSPDPSPVTTATRKSKSAVDFRADEDLRFSKTSKKRKRAQTDNDQTQLPTHSVDDSVDGVSPEAYKGIGDLSNRKKYEGLKIQKKPITEEAKTTNVIDDSMDVDDEPHWGQQQKEVDQWEGGWGGQPDFGTAADAGSPQHSEAWRTPIPSPMRSPDLVSRSKATASQQSEPVQQQSPPLTPVMQRTMTSFNSLPSPTGSPVFLARDVRGIERKSSGQNDSGQSHDVTELGNSFEDDVFQLQPEAEVNSFLDSIKNDLLPNDEDAALSMDMEFDIDSDRDVAPVIRKLVNVNDTNPEATPTKGKIIQIPQRKLFFSPQSLSKRQWKWTGPVRLLTGHGSVGSCKKADAEMICQAGLISTSAVVQGGMPFKVALSSVDAIDLRMYGIDHLKTVLAACKPVQQMAALNEIVGEQNDDGQSGGTGALTKVAQLMVSRQIAGIYEFYIDKCSAGIIVFFPPTQKSTLLSFLNFPEVSPCCAMAIALFPWLFPSVHVADSTRSFADVHRWDKQKRSEVAKIQMAHTKSGFDPPALVIKHCGLSRMEYLLQMLRFPAWLYNEMKASDRLYHLWSGDCDNFDALSLRKRHPDFSTLKAVDVECRALRKLLDKLFPRAKQVNQVAEKNVNANIYMMVFLHAASLRNLHKMPYLLDLKRRKDEDGHLSVAFYVFGTSLTMDPSDWRFEEVFPLGGVVTLTPTALAEDPAGLSKIIDHVADHPFWVGYVLPCVIGLAVKLKYRQLQLDPLAHFDRGHFLFESILSTIDDGKFALTRSPPPANDRLQSEQWIAEQSNSVLRDPRETLEFCIEEFESQYGHLQEDEWLKAVEDQISSEMRQMQIQPTIMNGYRRMVVLQGASIEEHCGGGVEWVGFKNFRFDDAADEELLHDL